jgi:acylglycerol lipase
LKLFLRHPKKPSTAKAKSGRWHLDYKQIIIWPTTETNARVQRLFKGLILIMLASILAACVPTIQRAQIPQPGFDGPRFSGEHFIAKDGAVLGLSAWTPNQDMPIKAVVVALHGMNDYARTFETAGPYWAERGIVTYAYDARGFGRSPQRGIWGGQTLMLDDLRTAVSVARAKHPGLPLTLVGESMGAATILAALGDDNPPQVDRVVLIAPAVWGWSNLPMAYRMSLWVTAHTPVSLRPLNPPRAVVRKITASDNVPMLQRLGRDPNMLFATRLDAVYGLVGMMERAYKSANKVPPQTLVLYGSKDQIIPRPSVERTVARLPAGVQSVEYPDGYHMLTRDFQAERVLRDIAAFIDDPSSPVPSRTGDLALGAIAVSPRNALKR